MTPTNNPDRLLGLAERLRTSLEVMANTRMEIDVGTWREHASAVLEAAVYLEARALAMKEGSAGS